MPLAHHHTAGLGPVVRTHHSQVRQYVCMQALAAWGLCWVTELTVCSMKTPKLLALMEH